MRAYKHTLSHTHTHHTRNHTRKHTHAYTHTHKHTHTRTHPHTHTLVCVHCRPPGLGSLHTLSDALILEMCGHLDARSLSSLSLASKACYCFSATEDLWKAHVLEVRVCVCVYECACVCVCVCMCACVSVFYFFALTNLQNR